MLKKIQAFQKLAKTVAAPFTQLRNIRAANKRDVAKTITSVPPKVNKTKLDEAKSKLAIQQQKTKASGAKLKQTLFESQNKDFKGKEFTFSPRVGRSSKVREGSKRGSNPFKKKSNIQKIKETFGPKQKPQSRMTGKKKKFPDLTGDGKVTFADVLKGRGVINGKKKNKKRFV